MFRVDKTPDYGSRFGDFGFEIFEIELIGLAEEPELPISLEREDRRRTTTEATVVNPCENRIVMRKL